MLKIICRQLTPLAIGLYIAGSGNLAWATSAQDKTDDDQEPVAPAAAAAPSTKTSKTDDEAPAAPAAPAARPAQPAGQAARLNAVNVTGHLDPYTVERSSTTLGTDTALKNTPFSVTALPRKVMDDQGVDSIAGAMRNVPGVNISLGEGNRDELYMRGVKTKSDFFIDGMRDDSEYIRPMYNVERVDVLKGPAALQFGRAGAGGIVNLVQKRADPEQVIRHGKFETGSWGKLKGTFDFNEPVGENGAFRLMGMREDSGGFRDHAETSRYGINPEFHYDFSDKTQMDLGFSYLHDHRLADRGIPSHNGHPDYRIKRRRFFGDKDANRYNQEVLAADFDLKHEVNKHLKLRNHFRWSRNDRDYTNFYAHTPTDDAGNFLFEGYGHPARRNTFQDRLEAIGTFDTGMISHKVLGGVDYTWQHDHDIETRPDNAGTQYAGKKTVAPSLYGAGNAFAQRTIDGVPMGWDQPGSRNRDNSVYAKELGVFLQDEVKLSKHWQALAGVRYDRFSSTANYRYHGENQHRVDHEFAPRGALMYKPTDNQTFYASFSRTYTPAGSNVALDHHSPDGGDIAPEKADSYELGSKTSLFDDRLLLSAAFFQINQSNIKDKDPNGDEKLPVGKHRTRGVELSANGNITDRWSVFANYAYIDSKTTRSVKDVPRGRRVALVPHSQFSVWSTYEINRHWGLGGGIHGESGKYASVSNEVKLPGYVVGDLMAYYQNDHYRLQVNVNNVTDKRYYETAQKDNQIMPGTPRSVVASLSMDFD